MNNPNSIAQMPATLAGLVHRLDQARRTGRREEGEEAATVSTSRYTDPLHWQQEQASLFGQWPRWFQLGAWFQGQYSGPA